MKWDVVHVSASTVQSHPSRGAWIEIKSPTCNCIRLACRTPHGVRGLKSIKLRHAGAG